MLILVAYGKILSLQYKIGITIILFIFKLKIVMQFDFLLKNR